MSKKKTTKPVRSTAPLFQNPFQEIEDLLESLSNNHSLPSASIATAEDTRGLNLQQRDEYTGVRWADFWMADDANDGKSSPGKQPNTKKKRKIRAAKPKTPEPVSPTEPQYPATNLKTAGRHRGNDNLNTRTRRPSNGSVFQIEPQESTCSDDEDTQAFLAKVQQLASQKKKAQEARISRTNKRTISDMQKLGAQTNEESRQIATKVSKSILKQTALLQAQAKALHSGSKRLKTECKRVKSETTEAVKQVLERTQSFSDKMKELTDKFKTQRDCISTQAQKEIDKEKRRHTEQMEKRKEIDRKLQQLHDLINSE